MDFLERDLEDIIYDQLTDERGLSELDLRGWEFIKGPFIVKRQFKIGNYGVADLVVFKRHSNTIDGVVKNYLQITVIELKRGKIDLDAVTQVARYKRGIERLYSSRAFSVFVRAIVIGNDHTWGDSLYLFGDLVGYTFYKYSYSWEGILFNEVIMNHSLNTENF